jgi:hypothetical protein
MVIWCLSACPGYTVESSVLCLTWVRLLTCYECVWTVRLRDPQYYTQQLYAAQPNHTQNTYYYDIYVDSEFLLKMVPPTIMVRRERLFILS